MHQTIVHTIEAKGHSAPFWFLALFVAASFLMIWRLEVMSGRGFEGTVLLVSHDRRFLENVTTRIVSVREGVADVYPGGFKDFAKKKAVYVVRQAGNGTEIRLPFNYEAFIKGKKGKHASREQDIQLKPHDTIVVP